MQNTIKIFRIFYDKLPPLVPADILTSMKNELEGFETRGAQNVDEVEDKMINFGYKVWPWMQAHKEMMSDAMQNMVEHFLLPRLSDGILNKYTNYKNLGMPLEDLYSGRAAHGYFTEKERVELAQAMVDARNDLDNYIDHQVVGLEKERFLGRVKDLEEILEDIKTKLQYLKELADREDDHENLANEIRARIRAFEQGLCLLGPALKHEEVEEAIEFFEGRKKDLNRLRGIHVPIQFSYDE